MERAQLELAVLPHGERRATIPPQRPRSLRELWADDPSPVETTRRPCDWCGKELPIGEPTLAVRVPDGGYSIRHQWCSRRGRKWRRRRNPAS